MTVEPKLLTEDWTVRFAMENMMFCMPAGTPTLRIFQSISGRISKMTNPKTDSQLEVRNFFTLSTQFTSRWLPILKANLRKVEDDAFRARSLITSVSKSRLDFIRKKHYENNPLHSGELVIDSISLDTFARDFNLCTRRHPSPNINLSFSPSVQSLSLPEGQIAIYQVIAFDNKDRFLQQLTFSLLSDGNPIPIQLPQSHDAPARYEIMTFNVKLLHSASWDGPLGKIEGKLTKKHRNAKGENYPALLYALSSKNTRIYGIQTASFLVTP